MAEPLTFQAAFPPCRFRGERLDWIPCRCQGGQTKQTAAYECHQPDVTADSCTVTRRAVDPAVPWCRYCVNREPPP